MGYLGGKGNCYSRVIGMMPMHRVYIETHLGGGAVMRAKKPAARQIGIDADRKVISTWLERGAPCELVHGDAIAFLREYPFTGEELVYADPPYPNETRGSHNRYKHDYQYDDHAALLDVLTTLTCPVLISGQPTPLYRERLVNWRCITFVSGARRGGRTEILWANFPEPSYLHDPIRAGNTYRERERLKRRLTTMKCKVERMEVAERSLFIEWLASKYPEHVSQPGRPGE